ncbi:thioredoxin domain-containing protein 3 [Rhinolophus ferrumequinum]|uniref:thioredoxin domain-containing protein 3 n=1 Tax=Rhinolophus ferrumequinum TaxID=59479 RepID=UPI00140FA99D|nr:thioredoxin domain-containing protein 3 [Rhinolophus ferrumequinum]
MAGKKREIQLQAVINNQSLWDEMLQNKGLTVIDVYQAWCGPCKAMQTLFRKLKNELNEDEILHFVVAEADSIVTLQSFRDKCEPIFLFSVNGKIIAKINGANAPLVSKKIIKLINEERKIAAGELVRPQYPEIAFVDTEDVVEASHKNNDKLYNMVIIKPEAVLTGKSIEIKEKPDFEDFVSLMTSGQSYILITSQRDEQEPSWEGTVPNPETESKELSEDQHEMATSTVTKKQDSLQEYMERQHLSEFCDIEENKANVNKFIDIFFPDFKSMKNIKLGRIMALLRPDLFQKRKEDVLNIIQDEGFKILMQRQIVLSKEEAQTLCKEHKNEDYYENLIENMTSGPSLALVLLRDNGLQHWKALIGPSTVEEAKECFPESLCVQFAMESLPINQLYGSVSLEAAEKEIEYFFPPQNVLGLIKPHVTHEQREEILNLIKENGFEITQMKELLLNEEQAEAIYFKIKQKHFYKDILEQLSEAPSLVMVLTKWNAISDWRRLMGPTDPNEAKLLSPDSIRARFGQSVLRNAVHGSSNLYEATETINRMFPPENPEEI